MFSTRGRLGASDVAPLRLAALGAPNLLEAEALPGKGRCVKVAKCAIRATGSQRRPQWRSRAGGSVLPRIWQC